MSVSTSTQFGMAALTSLLLVTACGQKTSQNSQATVPATQSEQTAIDDPASISLADIIAGAHRSDKDQTRDKARHPQATLEFFGLEPAMTVVEAFPGGGWYTQIIAPYIMQGAGTYYAAGFDPDSSSERVQKYLTKFRTDFVENPDLYGNVQMTVLSESSPGVAPDGSADMVLTFRNIHNWMSGGYADKVFADFYKALKPGGILGVVEHRLPEGMDQDPKAASGYVSEATVIAMAEKAGFELVAKSEINANPADTADHPFGVWTLPPTRRSSEGQGQPPAEDFDRAKYDAIGESDRMTLKFRKPVTADGALLE
ncbi:MAG: class I SAM-dependent methyltransferase [bacterium]